MQCLPTTYKVNQWSDDERRNRTSDTYQANLLVKFNADSSGVPLTMFLTSKRYGPKVGKPFLLCQQQRQIYQTFQQIYIYLKFFHNLCGFALPDFITKQLQFIKIILADLLHLSHLIYCNKSITSKFIIFLLSDKGCHVYLQTIKIFKTAHQMILYDNLRSRIIISIFQQPHPGLHPTIRAAYVGILWKFFDQIQPRPLLWEYFYFASLKKIPHLICNTNATQ